MLKSYLVTAWRNLLRQKGYAAINVLGMAIGLAFCILTFLFVRHEWSFDSFHDNADRILRVSMIYALEGREERQTAFTPHALAGMLREEMPEIEAVVRYSGERYDGMFAGDPHVKYKDKLFVEGVMFADPNVFESFSFPLRRGSSGTALGRPDGAILSERIVQKFFGREDPMGKSFSIRSLWNKQWYEFTVTGIVEEISENSSIRFDILLPYERMTDILHREIDPDGWGWWTAVTHIQLADRSQATVVEEKLNAAIQSDLLVPFGGGKLRSVRFELQPLTDIHLNPSIPNPRIRGLVPESDPVYSYVLGSIALLVLLMACINFTNLAIGRSTTRAREVGVRKVVGAGRRQLLCQFWGEAVLLSLGALVGGMVLAELLLPAFNGLVGAKLSFMLDGVTSGVLVGLALLVGLAAGSYPALVLSSFHPVEVLKGRLRIGGTSLWGRGLVIVQFAVSIFLVISAVVMLQQLHFIRDRDLGFNEEQVVVVNMRGCPEIGPNAGAHIVLRNSFLQHVDIADASLVRWPLERSGKGSMKSGDNRTIDGRIYYVGYDFLKTLEMNLVSGRDFHREMETDIGGSVIVNRMLADQIGEGDLVGEMLEMNGEHRQVIGVVEDFAFQSLHYQIQPAALVLPPSLQNGREHGRNLLVRIEPGNIAETLAYMEKKWYEIAPPDYVFRYSFFDEDIEQFYRKEQRWGKIVSYASLFAIFIACLGAFGLTSLAISRRTKEIGIRKVLGASIPSITKLLWGEFFRLMLAANLLAWPLAYGSMDYWLRDFAYRIDLGIEELVLGGALTLLLVMVTVGFQAIKAALSNPVDALRYE